VNGARGCAPRRVIATARSCEPTLPRLAVKSGLIAQGLESDYRTDLYGAFKCAIPPHRERWIAAPAARRRSRKVGDA